MASQAPSSSPSEPQPGKSHPEALSRPARLFKAEASREGQPAKQRNDKASSRRQLVGCLGFHYDGKVYSQHKQQQQ
eukprot:1158813-Pelagomonas_calceolata.AAC.3